MDLEISLASCYLRKYNIERIEESPSAVIVQEDRKLKTTKANRNRREIPITFTLYTYVIHITLGTIEHIMR